jgi:hypothetical protein
MLSAGEKCTHTPKYVDMLACAFISARASLTPSHQHEPCMLQFPCRRRRGVGRHQARFPHVAGLERAATFDVRLSLLHAIGACLDALLPSGLGRVLVQGSIHLCTPSPSHLLIRYSRADCYAGLTRMHTHRCCGMLGAFGGITSAGPACLKQVWLTTSGTIAHARAYESLHYTPQRLRQATHSARMGPF